MGRLDRRELLVAHAPDGEPGAHRLELRHELEHLDQPLGRDVRDHRAATGQILDLPSPSSRLTTPLVAEHVEPALAGLRVVCVSGRGDSTNVVEGVNLGVIAESAAVLPDDTWNAIDAADAWASVVAQRTVLWGWENCGVKPEGLPSPSSRRVPTAEGGFDEDVYDGNPATTFR